MREGALLHDVVEEHVDVLLEFSRTYIQRGPRSDDALLGLGLNRAEGRVLLALGGSSGGAPANWLMRRIGVEASYLSRIVRSFRAHGLTEEHEEPFDRRIKRITLTDRGMRLYRAADRHARDEARAMLDRYSSDDQHVIVRAMRALTVILEHRRR